MITMANVLKRGRTVWDRALLPEDEYMERARVLRERMAAEGLDAVLCLGHATAPGNFTYLSGYVPPLGWMGTLLGLHDGPMLVSGGGSREIPFVRTQTWIDDLRTSRSLFTGPAEVAANAVGEMIALRRRVGLAGAREALAPAAYAELTEALNGFEVVDADELMRSVRSVKRPREVLALQRAAAIAREAVETAVAQWRDGAGDADALLAAERAARLSGCRDVRVLGSAGGLDLAPVQERSDERGDALIAYCAVEHLGYWGQACAGTAEAPAATRAVEAMVAAASAGADAATLATAGRAELPGGADDVALSYGLGNAIGLDLSEAPVIGSLSGDQLPAGGVIALQAITRENGVPTCACQTIHVRVDGITQL